MPPKCDNTSNLEVQVTLFGNFRITVNGEDVRPRAQKDAALLAYLASEPNVPKSRGALASFLWPNSVDTRARESLKKALLRLRRALPEGMFLTDRNTALLSVPPESVDILLFVEGLGRRTIDGLETARSLFRSEITAEMNAAGQQYHDWSGVLHADLQTQFVTSARSLIHQFSQSHEPQLVQRAAQALHAVDPLDEQALRWVLRQLLSEARLRDAVRVSQDFRSLLDREIGVPPERATQELIATIEKQADRKPGPGSGAAATPDARPSDVVVAIAPFSVAHNDRAQTFIAEGLTQDITTDLSRTEIGIVLPPSIFYGTTQNPMDVAQARGASHVLEGSVRRAERTLRINTRLTEVESGSVVWAGRLDRPLEDVLSLQDEISQRVVEILSKRLTPALPRTAEAGTHSAHAYKMFLKGQSLYLRRVNDQSLRAAKALFQRALTIDPKFARAAAQISICDSYLAQCTSQANDSVSAADGLAQAIFALKLDSNLALAHAAKGLALYASGRYADAEHALAKAIEIDNNLFEAHFFLGRNRRLQGDRRGAVRHFEMALELRPSDFRASGLLAEEYQALGLASRAHKQVLDALNLVELELEAHPDNADALAFGAALLSDLGRREDAIEWMEWALAIAPGDSLVQYNVARAFAIMGELEQATCHLESAFETRPNAQRRLALWMRFDADLQPIQAFDTVRKYQALADPVEC